jgi:lipopolysaccharide heptosyltransferase II
LKVLLIRFSSLGDIVLTSHIPRLIKKIFPNAKVDMLVKENYLDLIKFNPNIDKKIILKKKSGFLELLKLSFELKREKYDFIVDLHKSLRSFIINIINWRTPKLYYSKKSFKRFLRIYTKINLFSKSESKMNDYLKSLEKFKVKYDGQGTNIFIDEKTNKKISKLINKKENKIIGIVPGARWRGKKWGKDKFKKLCTHIVDSTKFNIVLLGSKEDKGYDLIKEINPKRIKSFIGTTSILESASVLSFCDLVISNDTGMMHVAEALGKDVFCIMGATVKEFGFSPYRKKSKVIETNIWCRPCSKKGDGICIRKNKYLCLKNIKAIDVFNKIKDYFKV